MSIISDIRTASVEARKNRSEQASLLVTLLSEATMVGKNANRETTDDEAIAVIKKFIKTNSDTMSVITDELVHQSLEAEIKVLEQFLPKQLTREELCEVIEEIVASLEKPNMGSIMKLLKDGYGGTYDGGMASKLVKDMLG